MSSVQEITSTVNRGVRSIARTITPPRSNSNNAPNEGVVWLIFCIIAGGIVAAVYFLIKFLMDDANKQKESKGGKKYYGDERGWE